MITENEIKKYQGIYLNRGEDCIYIPPHTVLRPFISCYTITYPKDMPDDYTIIPSASSTMILSVNNDQIISSSLRAVNTKSIVVGKSANKMRLILLIEFRPGCLYPFVKCDQSELKDNSFPLFEINRTLTNSLEKELAKAKCIDDLVSKLDVVFISCLNKNYALDNVSSMINMIIAHKGNIRMQELSDHFYYSEKHIRRMFSIYVGASPKMFSRIARVNHTLQVMKSDESYLTDTAMQSGYFDQPHFIHDFRRICGIAPNEYIKNMSVFYNDEIKYHV